MASVGLGRILIVDDEQSVREVLSEYFIEQGYSVEYAGGGEEALALVQRSTPDLVLLDVRMPGIDGVETLRRIREIAPDVAVIMVTANEDVGLARETLKLGALDYVAKPFDFVYLERAIMAGLAQVGAAAATGVAGAPATPGATSPTRCSRPSRHDRTLRAPPPACGSRRRAVGGPGSGRRTARGRGRGPRR